MALPPALLFATIQIIFETNKFRQRNSVKVITSAGNHVQLLVCSAKLYSNTGFSKLICNVHIIIYHLQGVFQHLPNDVSSSQQNFSAHSWFSTLNKELPNSIQLEMCLNSCWRIDKLLWFKWNIWQLLKNILQTMKYAADILNWLEKPFTNLCIYKFLMNKAKTQYFNLTCYLKSPLLLLAVRDDVNKLIQVDHHHVVTLFQRVYH